MLNDLIKYYFLFFFTIHFIFKILNIPFTHKKHISFTLVFSFVLAFIMSIFSLYSFKQGIILLLIIIWCMSNFFITNPRATFLATTLSFVINYCIFAIAGLFSLIIIFPFNPRRENFPFTFLIITTIALYTLLTISLLHLKRFKKGMPFLFSTATINLSTTICLIFLGYLIYRYMLSNQPALWVRVISPILFVILILFLIHWWQAQITKSYKQALVQRELESLRTELQEKDRLLAEISAKNEELGRLIHKDNKRIPAMEHAVSEFLVMDFNDKEAAIERANTLLIEVKELAQDRDNTITEIYSSKFKHHNTGINSLDTMLNYMEKRAHGEHIKLSVNIALDLNSFIPSTLTVEDLSHVLSDLLENAIIAAKQNASPLIQLQFYQAGKDFIVEIADNGNPFEANVLVNYGLEQLTTHADTGGSGIGLMDIWKIKEKYGASLHITEYENDAPYTKKIALIFNKKNRYTISTERKEELLSLSRRSDLQIF